MKDFNENEGIIYWLEEESCCKIMDSEYWEMFPLLYNEEVEQFICLEDDIDKYESSVKLLKSTDYFTSPSFGSWSKSFNECTSNYPAQYDLRDGDEVWIYQVETTNYIPIGVEITVPYNFIEEKDYFDEAYSEKYGRFVGFKSQNIDEKEVLTLGHIISIENGKNKPYHVRMVSVRTYSYGELIETINESYIFTKCKIKDHYHYISFYHIVLDVNNYTDDNHVINCLRCDDCFYEMASVIKKERNLELPLKTIVDGILKKSMNVNISAFVNRSPKIFKKCIKNWLFKYNTYQLIVKILHNFNEIEESLHYMYNNHTTPHEIIKEFNNIIGKKFSFPIKDVYKCCGCSSDLFRISDAECFSPEGNTIFRIDQDCTIYQLRTFKNCISGKVFVNGFPISNMSAFEGYKWRFLYCTDCQYFIGLRFESRIYKPSIFYAVTDDSVYSDYSETNKDRANGIQQTLKAEWEYFKNSLYYEMNDTSTFNDDDFNFFI